MQPHWCRDCFAPRAGCLHARRARGRLLASAFLYIAGAGLAAVVIRAIVGA